MRGLHVFGSCVWGEETEGSDLDWLVAFEETERQCLTLRFSIPATPPEIGGKFRPETMGLQSPETVMPFDRVLAVWYEVS